MRAKLSRLNLWRLLSVAALLMLLALLLSGCATNTTQNTFDARGDVAKTQRDIFYLAMWPAIGVMILVEAGVVLIMLRFRRRKGDALPKQVHGNTRLELAWTIAPALLLAVVTVPMVVAIWDIGRKPSADALPIKVTGIQWAWQFEYEDIKDSSGKPLSSLRELHIPVGREIGVTVTAVDVIHSFWVPKLAGKLDAIPGETNTMWLKADEPGSFSGQCSEFCGRGHADMKLVVIAQSPDDFQKWVDSQKAKAQENGPDSNAVSSAAAGGG